jgi:hypothetical protein
MEVNNELDCKIFAETDRIPDELARLIAQHVAGSVSGPAFARTVHIPLCDIEVRKNPDANASRTHEAPESFLFFRLALEIYPSAAMGREQRVNLIAGILRFLWSQQIPAVAACDYEAELPGRGGYDHQPPNWHTKAPASPVPDGTAAVLDASEPPPIARE